MPRILVVDDEVLVLETLTLILRNAGYDVTACSSPRDALTILGERGSDFILTDMHMPHMNGLEMAQAATRVSPSCHVIILSGQPLDKAMLAQDTTCSQIEVLLKPMHPQALIARLQHLTSLQNLPVAPMLPRSHPGFSRRREGQSA